MRSRLLAGAAALVALAGCGEAVAPPGAPAAVATPTPAATGPPGALADDAIGAWESVARSPLSARNRAALAWTGSEVLVLGGEREVSCDASFAGRYGAMYTCAAPETPPLRDGAAYDPAAGTWRRIAVAPVPVGQASVAVRGGTAYVLAYDRRFLAYDLAADRWRELRAPPGTAKLVTVGRRLVAYDTSGHDGVRDHYWTGRRWRVLPAAPDGPVHHREMAEVGGLGVVVGQPGGVRHYARNLRAAVLDPVTLTWLPLRTPAGADGAGLLRYDPQPLLAADGKAVSASPYDGRGHREPQPAIGGVFVLLEGWTALPPRPLSRVEREAAAERKRAYDAWEAEHGPVMSSNLVLGPYKERFTWLAAAGDGFVVAGRWAYDLRRGLWQHVPTGSGPVRLQDSSSIWAGDRVFVWGGVHRGRANTAAGWTWRPARP